jgi:hypothetical protein
LWFPGSYSLSFAAQPPSCKVEVLAEVGREERMGLLLIASRDHFISTLSEYISFVSPVWVYGASVVNLGNRIPLSSPQPFYVSGINRPGPSRA